jgi:signal peptidase II
MISELERAKSAQKRWFFILIAGAAVLIGLDQYTKALALAHLQYGVPVPVLEPWLNWTLVYNYGAAFSFLSQAGGLQHWLFVAIAAAAALLLPVWIRKLDTTRWVLALALALIWSGATGNLIDRLRYRYVVDFIHVHWRDVWNYPVFNVADSAITVGAVLLIVYELFLAKKLEKNQHAAPSEPSQSDSGTPLT